MALSKFSMNVIFASVVAVLGITAAVTIYNAVQPAEMATPQASQQLPEGHPPPGAAEEASVLLQMVEKSPEDPEALTQLANHYYDAGQYREAVEFYQRSLKVRPQDPNVETDLATCFHYLGENDKSLETLNRVLTYNPGFLQARLNKGIVLIEGKKDLKNGIAAWEELLRTNPGYPHRAELEQRIEQLKSTLR